MPPEKNENKTERIPESTSFVQQRLRLAFENLEKQSDVDADLASLISEMNERGQKSFWFDEEDMKSPMMPGGHAVTWRSGIEVRDDPKDGRKIKLTVIRFNDKITDGDEDTTVYSARTNPFGNFDFKRESTVKRKLDMTGVKSEEVVDYPIEDVRVVIAKLHAKYLPEK